MEFHTTRGEKGASTPLLEELSGISSSSGVSLLSPPLPSCSSASISSPLLSRYFSISISESHSLSSAQHQPGMLLLPTILLPEACTMPATRRAHSLHGDSNIEPKPQIGVAGGAYSKDRLQLVMQYRCAR